MAQTHNGDAMDDGKEKARIPDTSENSAKAMFRTGEKPESDWWYLRKKRA